ncbi:type IV pilus secretin PilQ [Candidatus Binatia bacterium]|nr:type IV pilus secretin PilQ [Candidatus Binatia bacterium]
MPDGATAGDAVAADVQRTVATAPIGVREIKLIDDNGQQGLFTKLSGPPAALTHFTMTQPPRVVIDIAGAAGVTAAPEATYAADNPVVESVRVAGRDGSIRLTVNLRGDTVPSYTVSDLNETVVAFFGEPGGGSAPVAEQVLLAPRAEDVAPRTAARPRPAPPPVPRRRPAPPPVERSGAPGDFAAAEPVDAPSPRPTPKLYYGQHVSLDFKDADVNNVLRLLAEVSRLNIVATDDVKGRVTLRLFDVPWDQALDILLQVLNLESVHEGDVIRISTVKRLREEREEQARAQEAQKAVEPLEVEYIRVNYAKASKLAELISGAAARTRGQQTTRGARQEDGVLSSRGSVFSDEYANMLIVRDIRRGIENALELVRKLDVQTPQVLIESSIVEATTDFARDLGVQWGYRYLAGPAVGSSTGVNFPGAIGLGGSGLGTGGGGVPFIADFPAAGVVPGSGTALALALGSLDGSQSLDVRLTALEKEGKARIISRPRVVTLNNVAATIKSLRILRVKLPSTGTVINTGAGGAAGGQSTATEKIETGIILVVTPQVSSDGFVLLDMFAKSSTADFAQQVDQIPTEVSREANSHILVKNGQTIVLGGIYRDNLSDAVTGVPFLRDIPGLGWLFRTNSTKSTREDLLVFLTPRIVGGGGTGLPTAERLWEHRGVRKEG